MYTACGAWYDPARFIRILVETNNSQFTISLHLAQVNGVDVTNTSKIVIYGIKY